MAGIALHLAHRFGLFGIGAGAALEGEAAVTIGGILARHGLFSPFGCAVAACLGSFLADQLVFWLAASRRESAFVRRLADKSAFARALGWIDRHPALFCFAFRFIYGLRIAGPAALGFSHVRFRTFVPLNLVSAAIWGSVFTYVGYRFGRVFGNALARLLHTPHIAVEIGAAAALALFGAAVAYFQKRRERVN